MKFRLSTHSAPSEWSPEEDIEAPEGFTFAGWQAVPSSGLSDPGAPVAHVVFLWRQIAPSMELPQAPQARYVRTSGSG